MIASRRVKTATIEPSPRDSGRRLRALFEAAASENGFQRIGIARADAPPHWREFEAWIASGYHASMAYLERSRDLRRHPATLLPGARSVIVLAHAYPAGEPVAADGARTARYALAEDYHRTLRRKAGAVVAAVRAAGVAFASRICVDSAPLNERDFAAAAGIGWIGKNGMVLNREDGSWFLLCEIVTDLDLPADAPQTDQCGNCTRCIDACPTDAFVRPGVLDAGRCLSYWTIEQRGVIPEDVAARMNGWVFGCDVCQEVCPYNGAVDLSSFERTPPTLEAMLDTGSAEWKRRFGDTPLARAGAAGMRRNAAAAAGGAPSPGLLPVLERLARGSHPVVAEQARRAVRTLEHS
jgi:epoxyqueuosine reductase